MGVYFRLIDFDSQDKKEQAFLTALENDDKKIKFYTDSSNFSKIPGSPIAYWVSEKIIENYKQKNIYNYANPCKGIDTGDNNIFLRLWAEVSLELRFIPNGEIVKKEDFKHKKWFPYNKGGEYRKWYGNNEYVINWGENGTELKSFKGSNLRNKDKYFNKGITWSTVACGGGSFRYFNYGYLFDNGGSCLFASNHLFYIQAFLNSTVAQELLTVQPTLNNQPGTIGGMPLIVSEDENIIEKITKQNIQISKTDWDSYETSWDFKKHPLI